MDVQWVLSPMRQKKGSQQPGGEGKDDICDRGLYVQKLESRSVQKQNETITRKDHQSLISSNMEHVKHEETQIYLSVSYQHSTACT